MGRQNSGGSNEKVAGLSHESENGTLTVFVRGSVSLATATAYATRHQQTWSAHDRILWDLRDFDPSGVTSSDILNIQHAFAEIMDLRTGGRSALLVGKELDQVARVALALYESKGEKQAGPITVRSFQNAAQAVEWLEGEQ